jgi:putative Holliday junction resolvase
MSRSSSGKLLALDVGLARIGVAVCDPLGLVARPLCVIQRRSRNEDFAQLAEIAAREEAQGVICGLPLNMDGSEGQQAATTRTWARRLANALRALIGRPVPIEFWDERLSSWEARALLQGDTQTGEDAAAAAVILQAFLDARRRGDTTDYGRVDLPEKRVQGLDQNP